MRYAIANLLYRLRFPSGEITATDFRPQFQGHLLNVITTISPGLKGPEAVEAALSRRLRQSFRWMRLLRFLVRDGDKVQYCLLTSQSRQLCLKAWSSRGDLAAHVPPRDVANYWGINNGVLSGR